MAPALFGQLNDLILLVSYIVYLCSGLILFLAGIIYSATVGAVAQTGIYLCWLGLFFLVLGTISLFGLKLKNAIILFVVEVINVVLFFVLFIVIVAAIMIGSGARDPIQKLYDENWDTLKMQVYGANAATFESFCTTGEFSTNGNNAKCIAFYGAVDTKANCLTVKQKGEANTPGTYGLNCSKFDDELGSDCPALKTMCVSCANACKAMAVKESKNKNIPACIITILVCLYLLAVCVMHTICRLTDGGNSEALCCKEVPVISLVTMGIDSGFAFLGLVTIFLALTVVKNPDENFSDGSGALWFIMFCVGLGLLAVPSVQIYLMANHKNPIYELDIVLMVMFFALSLVAVFLGFLSGALVQDMNSLYDQNYAQYRGELELMDASYCSLNKADCKKATVDGAAILPLPLEDRDDSGAVGMATVNVDDLWQNQHAQLQLIPYRNLPPSFALQVCDSSELCIRCMPAIEKMAAKGFNFTAKDITTGGASTYNDTRDMNNETVWKWTGNLNKAIQDDGGFQGPTARQLYKCQNELLAMSGKSMASYWDSFPNPAADCAVLDSVSAGGLGRGFMMRLPTDDGYKVQENMVSMASSAANATGTGTYKPKISAKEYNQTYQCAKYLIAMTDSTTSFASKSKCKSSSACRTAVKADFDSTYDFMSAAGVGFCTYPDVACKAKVSFVIEKKFNHMSIIGIFIMIFQLGVIFTTYFGIMQFVSSGGGSEDSGDGDGGDDGGDGGDDDAPEEEAEEEEEEAAEEEASPKKGKKGKKKKGKKK